MQSFITPSASFYVRGHGDIPDVDAGSYRLNVAGQVERPLDLSLAELQKFQTHEIIATLQCAGNRRAGMHAFRPVMGDPWRVGAIGTAVWRGIRLADILAAAGAPTRDDLHVVFDALDECNAENESFRYGVSIPMAKALSPEVLLAFAMNGDTLTPEHGFPLRAIVPGYAGARSPKWVSRITVAVTASANPMQSRDYKLLPPHMTPDNIDWSLGLTIDEMPLTSAITSHEPGAAIPAGPTRISGYAIVSGRRIARVDVSADGVNWAQAELLPGATAWSWQFWRAVLNLPPGPCELIVRAWDSAGQTQPARPEETWNCRGYLNNSWHRVPVIVS